MSKSQVAFMREHMRRVFTLLYQVSGNTEDAQRLTQEVFILAFQRGRGKNLKKTGRLLPALAGDVAIEYLRGKKQFAAAFESTGMIPPTPGRLFSAEQRHRDTADLKGALDVLTAPERLAVLLHETEHMPASQVAKHMQCSVAAVRMCLAKARIKFRQLIQPGKPQ